MAPASYGTPGGPTLYLTGERTLPGIGEENYWYARHVAGYRLAYAHVARGNVWHVLDSGCGEGYGSHMLAAAGVRCTGADVFAPVLEHARRAYPDVMFVRTDACTLPFSDGSFDMVVGLQVIEHVGDPGAYVQECRRVLRPGGAFLCSTPNRLTFTPPGRPKNPFHVVEFSAEGLSRTLRAAFTDVEVAGLVDEFPGLADSLIEAALAGEPPPAWAEKLVPAVTVDQFHVSDDPDTSLDLVATCR